MTAWYNENDPKAAAWLRELIRRNLIAPGIVDERSIEDVRPIDLAGYAQCHFFAGIGGWSYALRLAGWPDDRPVWTGSCPCQPFSAAGKGDGFADERHLWPAFHFLIGECRPDTVFGEQVASKDGLAWLDLVHADLETTGYAFGAFDLCAAGFGAPHIRQRLYFVAESECAGLERYSGNGNGSHEPRRKFPGQNGSAPPEGTTCRMGNTENKWASRHSENGEQNREPPCRRRSGNANNDGAGSPTNGHWRDVDWLFCRDGKWRPVEPGTFPLAHGLPARVERLRGYGNAIVVPQAAAFVEAYRYGRGFDLV